MRNYSFRTKNEGPREPRQHPLPREHEEEPQNAPREYQREVPEIETRVFSSKDGEWIITKVTITTIKHRNFYEAVLRDSEPQGPRRPR